MEKKNFAEGIDAVLGGTIIPKTKLKNLTSDNIVDEKIEERTSVDLNVTLIEKLRAIAFWERSTLKTEIKNAIEQYLIEKGDAIVEEALKHFRAKKAIKKSPKHDK